MVYCSAKLVASATISNPRADKVTLGDDKPTMTFRFYGLLQRQTRGECNNFHRSLCHQIIDFANIEFICWTRARRQPSGESLDSESVFVNRVEEPSLMAAAALKRRQSCKEGVHVTTSANECGI